METTTHGVQPGMDTPKHDPIQDTDRLRVLADRFDCLTEDDLVLLTNTKVSTVDAWRRRGKGPEYILIGNRYFYTRQSVADFLENCTRQRTPLGKALL